MKIKINLLFWEGNDPQRLENTKLSWYYLKRFCTYINSQKFKSDYFFIEPRLFDLSQNKILNEEAIHIPFPKGSYERSAKINKVIEYLGEEEYFFSVIDSDIIFKECDYETWFYLLNSLKNDKFYVVNLDDLINFNGIDFNSQLVNFDQVQTKERVMNPDLGALFFLNINLLKIIGGFNEEYKIYGGEDNFCALELNKRGFSKIVLPLKPIHLLHSQLYPLVCNTEQYQKQLKLLIDNGYKI